MAGPYLMAETLAGLGRRAEARALGRGGAAARPNDPRARQLADGLTPPMRRHLPFAAPPRRPRVVRVRLARLAVPGVPGRPRRPRLDRHPARRPPARLRLREGSRRRTSTRLRRDAILFENAYSQVPLTLPSHLSMLTGLLPAEHGVRTTSATASTARAPDPRPDPPRSTATRPAPRSRPTCCAARPASTTPGTSSTTPWAATWRGRADAEPAQRPGGETVAARPGLGRGREVAALLPLRARLRAAPALRAPEPFRSPLRARPTTARWRPADAVVGRARSTGCGALGLYDRADRHPRLRPRRGPRATTASRSTGSCSTARCSTSRSSSSCRARATAERASRRPSR